jgi:hypothetical protein
MSFAEAGAAAQSVHPAKKEKEPVTDEEAALGVRDLKKNDSVLEIQFVTLAHMTERE